MDIQGDSLGLAPVCVYTHTASIDSVVAFGQLGQLH